MPTFTDKVRLVVNNIPKGEVLTYAEVAKKAGNPMAYRAVASVMAKNFDESIPCHRVIRSDGTLGDYNRGGILQKMKILEAEGVILFNMSNHTEKLKEIARNIESLESKKNDEQREFEKLDSRMTEMQREVDKARGKIREYEDEITKLTEKKRTEEDEVRKETA